MSRYVAVETVLAALALETNDEPTRAELGAMIVRVSDTADQALGFAFDGEAISRTLDGPGGVRLYLPAPGAMQVSAVTENGIALTDVEYELDARAGQFLLRLDASNQAVAWTAAGRGIVVTYTPNEHPAALEDVAFTETIRAWNGRQAGYPDVIGVDPGNQRRYARGFSNASLDTLRRIGARYGIRDLMAV